MTTRKKRKKRKPYVAFRAMYGKALAELKELRKMKSSLESQGILPSGLIPYERSIKIQQARANRAGKRLGPIKR